MVLWSLTKAPYEPMNQVALLDWSTKTYFLLAFASGKRRGELHALSMDDRSLVFGKESVTLCCEVGFLAKTQVPGQAPRPFVVPALSKAGPLSAADNLLCPVRALRYYLSMTESLRGRRKRLLIPCVGSHDVSKASISRWISMAIRRAYRSTSSKACKKLKVKAHEVRAVSTSWAFLNGVPLEQVMSKASWRSLDHFLASSSLRALTAQSSDIYTLGPLVAAGTVVAGKRPTV